MEINWECAQLSTAWHHPDKTLLDIAIESDIEMVSACGGKTICSTCKVEVLEGLDYLMPRTPEEARIAERLNWHGQHTTGLCDKIPRQRKGEDQATDQTSR